MHVLGRPDQRHDREVDLDEVREVAELVEPPQLLEVARHRARVPGGQLADDPRRRRADVVDVQLGLGQSADELLEAVCERKVSPRPLNRLERVRCQLSTAGQDVLTCGDLRPDDGRGPWRSWIRLLPWTGTSPARAGTADESSG